MKYDIIIGFLAATLTTVSFAPQALKVFKTRNTESISALMYILFVTGVILWVVYGFIKNDMALLIGNIITFLLSCPVLIIVLKNKNIKVNT